MARRRQPSAASILRALKIDPLREIAAAALKLEEGSPERIAAMWELVPWVYAKPRPEIEVSGSGGDGPRVWSVRIGGED